MTDTRSASGLWLYGYFDRSYVSLMERGIKKPTPDTVEYYIVKFGADRQALNAAFHDADQEAAARKAHAGRAKNLPITPDSTDAVIQSAYRVVDTNIWYNLNERGTVAEEINIVSLEAARPGVEYFVCNRLHETDERRGLITIIAGGGCELAQADENDAGVGRAVFRLAAQPPP